MYISYSGPLSRGWERMKKALFQPFNIVKWINIGFTAFLAGLTDFHGSSSGNNSGYKTSDWDDFFNFPQTAWNWLSEHPLYSNLILLGIVLLIIFTIVLVWLSSRGKFMFLYNVVHNRDEVSLPWREYKKEGNSLFWWRFVFGWIVFIVFMAFFILCFNTAKTLYYGNVPVGAMVWTIAGLVLLFLFLIITVSYISLYLNDFVVPIMYKYRLGINRAWIKFLGLFVRHIGSFIVYGLFIFILGIAVALVVIFFALVTCCIGLLLIVIPFVGSVILLPVSYTFRALSVEFLAQFGENYNLFPEQEIEVSKNE